MPTKSKRKPELFALGDLITARRKELGLSQEELSDRMTSWKHRHGRNGKDINKNYVGRVERAEIQPGFHHLGWLIKSLEISADELFAGHDSFD